MEHMQDAPSSEVGTWEELGLSAELLAAVGDAGFKAPSDIQWALIPPALAGRDCLGQAKTGTGKTAAFAIPILQMVTPRQPVQALVLVPTRELAAQVDEHVRTLAGRRKFRTALVYGGQRIQTQIRQLKAGAEIVIGTPGRILDLMHRRELDIANVRFAVLDEVDRMLDIGFRDDIRRILRAIKAPHQTLFVSATITEDIRRLAKSYMENPLELNVSQDDHLTVETIDQAYVTVDPRDKAQTLIGFLQHEKPKLAIVFTNTKHAARRTAERLKMAGINCKEIHGDLMQSRRERVMKSFRSAKIQVLVATDLASRGLDVMEVSHIVNYDVPADAAAYVHRIGRTARMGKQGYAITFVRPDEGNFLTEIEKLINKELRKLDAPWIVPLAPQPVAPPAADDEEQRSTRFAETLRRCRVLDAHGVQPVPRTLGSRFRSSRRRR
ncbi:MAG: DEAD/DEAH box helicase [Phycisphaerae bacterium]|jgi:ATP-dependent RNA helicase DeaD